MSDARPLTQRQREVLDWLLAETTDRQRLPTRRDLAAYLGATSAHAAQDYVRILEDKGYLARTPRGARREDLVRIVRDSHGRPVHLTWTVDTDIDTDTHPPPRSR